jgi:amino acid transporter
MTETETAQDHGTVEAVIDDAEKGHKKLTVWPATAICGNDITSSCLYVSALAVLAAGALAPISLLIVAAVLYLFRGVYAEAVGALPINGGAYNTLLNTTSKFRATIAAALTILSYMATAVISGIEAVHYILHMIPPLEHLKDAPDSHGVFISQLFQLLGPEAIAILLTVVLLSVFAGLTAIGISESAFVALLIFIFHMATLTVLVLTSCLFIYNNGLGQLQANWELGWPDGNSWMKALFFGFAAAMLGISGFESSSNYVEEQAPGVFPKTLRNMWIAVSVFNPTIAILVLCVMPIYGANGVEGNTNALLATVGDMTAGAWLKTVVSINAALVLSGAVLTSFVGVNGLVYRMTLDRCLPQGLLVKNRRGAPYRVTICFLLAGISVLYITAGDVKALAGVYTISFLSVMALFALGNMLLKVKRARLPRPSRAPWPGVIIALAAVLAGIVGNIVRDPRNFWIFTYYFIPTMLAIMIMLTRIQLLYGVLYVVRSVVKYIRTKAAKFDEKVRDDINQITSQTVVFFTRGDNLANLNKAVLYIRANEHTRHVKVVNIVREEKDVPERLPTDLKLLDEEYPDMMIEFEVVEGKFGPELLSDLSQKWNVPLNFMFMGCPGAGFPHGIGELGGVRVII